MSEIKSKDIVIVPIDSIHPWGKKSISDSEIKVIPEFPMYAASKSGRIFSGKTGAEVKQLHRSDGYFSVNLSAGKKQYKVALVHRLVAFAHIPKIEGKNFINHRNGDKSDNRVENLEWCTQRENIIHARDVLGVKHGKGGRESGNWFSTESEDHQIREWYRNNVLDQFELAKFFGVHVTAIMSRINGGRISGRRRYFNCK